MILATKNNINIRSSTYTNSLLFIGLISFTFPRLINLQVGNGQLYFGASILLMILPFLRLSLAPYIVAICIAPSALLGGASSNLLTIGYYGLAMLMLFTSIQVSRQFLYGFLMVFGILTFFSIFLDYYDPSLIDTVASGERALDSRTTLGLTRPVGFFRESSEMGMMLAIATFLAVKEGFTKLAVFLILMLFLSQSFMGLLLFPLLMSVNGFIKLRIFLVITFVIVALYFGRFLSVAEELSMSDMSDWYLSNFSSVKRIIHPFIGLQTVMENMNSITFLFGLVPGSVSTLLSINFSHMTFSDLSAGYMLNTLFNIFANFGLFGLVVFLWYAWFSRISTNQFMSLIILMFCGMAFLHPAFLLINLRVKKTI